MKKKGLVFIGREPAGSYLGAKPPPPPHLPREFEKASEAIQDTPPPVRNLNPEPPKHQQEF